MIPFVLYILIAAYSSYTDLRYRKINNRLLFSGLLIEAAVFFLTGGSFRSLHSMNAVLAVLLAIIVWKVSIWAAGDAKFFIFSSISCSFFAQPALETASRANVPLALILLCNSLIIAFCFIFLEGVVDIFSRLKSTIMLGENALRKARLQKMYFIQRYGKVYLAYVFAFIFFSLVSPVLSVPMGYVHAPRIIFFAAMYALYTPVSRMSKSIPFPVFLGITGVGLWIQRSTMLLTLKQSLLFFIFVTVVNAVISRRTGACEQATVPRDMIRPGLMIAQEETDAIDPAVRKAGGIDNAPDGLTQEQAGWWRAYCAASSREGIQTYITFPFVPFITLAAALAFFLGARPITLYWFLR